jgi:hypothetical protein
MYSSSQSQESDKEVRRWRRLEGMKEDIGEIGEKSIYRSGGS